MDVGDTPHAFKEKKPFVVLLLAEANTQFGVLKSSWSGAVSKQPGLTAVPQQGQAKLIFQGNTGAASAWGYYTAQVAYICLMSV